MTAAVSVGLRELRQDASDIVRRVEAGEEFIITVSGRPSARLISFTRDRQWRTYDEIAEIFQGEPDPDWDHDRDLLDQRLRDPWPKQ